MSDHWPLDRAACAGKDCRARRNCQRHLAHQRIEAERNRHHWERQAYIGPDGGQLVSANGACQEYWPEVTGG